MAGFSIHHQIEGEALNLVKSMGLLGAKTGDIMSVVNSINPLIARKDVQNLLDQFRRDKPSGRNHTQALVDALTKSALWYHKHQTDQFGCLTHLFFVHYEDLALLRDSPEVLMMDCMYKTNVYGMPLLNIIAVNASG